MNLKQVMSYLEQTFPEMKNRQAVTSARCPRSREPMWDEHDFARFVVKEMAQGKSRRVQLAFDRLEELLYSGEIEVRDWVWTCVEAVNELSEWQETGEEWLVRFLGPETRRGWEALEAIRGDLAECSTLEAEVTMWRAVHHTGRQASLRG